MTQSQMQAPLLVSSDVASEAVDSSAAVDLQMVPTAVLMGDGSEAAQDAQEQHAELGPERDPADPQEWATGVLDCCATPYSRVWYGLSCPCCLYADISLHMNRRQDADDADGLQLPFAVDSAQLRAGPHSMWTVRHPLPLPWSGRVSYLLHALHPCVLTAVMNVRRRP